MTIVDTCQYIRFLCILLKICEDNRNSQPTRGEKSKQLLAPLIIIFSPALRFHHILFYSLTTQGGGEEETKYILSYIHKQTSNQFFAAIQDWVRNYIFKH